MAGSLDDSDISVIDGREVILLVVVEADGQAKAGFNGMTQRQGARLLRELADKWERQAAAPEN